MHQDPGISMELSDAKERAGSTGRFFDGAVGNSEERP
jgi:hypothetical protein